MWKSFQLKIERQFRKNLEPPPGQYADPTIIRLGVEFARQFERPQTLDRIVIDQVNKIPAAN